MDRGERGQKVRRDRQFGKPPCDRAGFQTVLASGEHLAEPSVIKRTSFSNCFDELRIVEDNFGGENSLETYPREGNIDNDIGE